MNIHQLECFKQLARYQHYSKAAAILNISQPSLSRIISSLEKELGIFLFEKKGRNIILTKYGTQFYEYINRGLNEINNGIKLMQNLSNEQYGQVDFAYIYTVGYYHIPKLIKKYQNDTKNVKFNLLQGNTYEIISWLKNGTCDIALCSHFDNEPLIEFNPFMEQDLVLMVSPNHPLVSKKNLKLKDIINYPLILPYDKTNFIPDLLKSEKLVPHILCHVKEDCSIAGLVSINYGIALIPYTPLLDHFNVELFYIKGSDGSFLKRRIYIAHLKNSFNIPSVAKFKKFLLNNATEFTI